MNATLPTIASEWNVLLVEDVEPELKELYLILAKMVSKVDWAESASVAQAQLDQEVYQLMLLDLKLPDRDGLELAKFVRQESKWNSMRIVILGTDKDDTQLTQVREMRLDGFLKKPLTAELCQTLFFWLSSAENEGGFFIG